MRWWGFALVVIALALGCAPSGQPTHSTLPQDPETIPDTVLDESDPMADTSGNRVLSRGGCGGWLNPCPDVTRPRGGCFGCPPATGENGTFPLRGAAPFVVLVLLMRRRSRRG